MRTREDKRDAILDAGLAVLYLQGYNGTGVKDIVDEAGIPKGSFYNYFKSKEDFAIEALQRVAGENIAWARSILLEPTAPPLERLERFFRVGVESAQAQEFKLGCLMGNLCQELADVNPRIRDTVAGLFKRLTAVFAECLAEAQNKGDIPAQLDVHQTADFIFNAWEGALLRMKCDKNAQALEAFITVLPNLVSNHRAPHTSGTSI